VVRSDGSVSTRQRGNKLYPLVKFTEYTQIPMPKESDGVLGAVKKVHRSNIARRATEHECIGFQASPGLHVHAQ